MNTLAALPRHPFLDGMLIGGEWVEAASAKTFESINPSTGRVLATVAEGDAEDIQRAVEAARRAFDGGREGGQQHLEEYLNIKAVWIKTD